MLSLELLVANGLITTPAATMLDNTLSVAWLLTSVSVELGPLTGFDRSVVSDGTYSSYWNMSLLKGKIPETRKFSPRVHFKVDSGGKIKLGGMQFPTALMQQPLLPAARALATQ
jgi:hypothetical protein